MHPKLVAVPVTALAALGLAVATPTAAQEEPVCTDSLWIAQDTGATGVQTVSTVSEVGEDITLTWEAGHLTSAAGTSAENLNLGVPVTAGDTISVDYELVDGADPAAGSVRLFVYYAPNSDTWTTAPDQFVAAPDDGSLSGTLEITGDTTGVIGTIGVVYDTSNGGVEGTVVFSNLMVAGDVVSFVCDAPPDTTSTTTPPTTTPTTTPGQDGAPGPVGPRGPAGPAAPVVAQPSFTG